MLIFLQNKEHHIYIITQKLFQANLCNPGDPCVKINFMLKNYTVKSRPKERLKNMLIIENLSIHRSKKLRIIFSTLHVLQ